MEVILSIVPYPFLPPETGGQKGVALFYKYFSLLQPVICVSTEKNDRSYAQSYELLNILPATPLRYINPGYIFSLGRLIRQRKVTHLILEHPYYGWLGVILKWRTGVKLVVHSHNIEGLRWKTLGKWWWRILWQYEKWVHRRSDYNFFIQDADRDYAIRQWGLMPERCLTVTYGLERNGVPSPEERQQSREDVRQQYGISDDKVLLFFNGAFNYRPNLDALIILLEKINPLLQQQEGFAYHLLICGKDIPDRLSQGKYPHVSFAGFVKDIDSYFRAADVFLNPIVDGGGIKTKLVEALGSNLNAVSVENGAIGIDPAWCNGKLLICDNHDWEAFARLTVQAADVKADIPEVYFEHFYWGNSTKKAAAFIKKAPAYGG